MSSKAVRPCSQLETVATLVLRALPVAEAQAAEAHLAACSECRGEKARLEATVRSFAHWPTDILRPAVSQWERVAQRIGIPAGPAPARAPVQPDWEPVAPGISCKLLATDTARSRVSMLVRLAPGTEYPPHTHAGVEELHLLDGELWIDNRKLYPGDYNRAEPGTADRRVFSETGCTCVLVTSPRDQLTAS